MRWLLPLALLACTESDLDTGSDSGETADTSDTENPFPFDSAPQAPVLVSAAQAPTLTSGQEVILLLNGRPSDANTQYSTNRVEQNRLIGPDVFLYDPAQPGKLFVLGRPDYGALDGYQGQERQKLYSYEAAWHATEGLWAMQLEPTNDEWLLVQWHVESWTIENQIWETSFYGVPVSQDRTDSLYWEDGVDAMDFVGDRLVAGTTSDYSSPQGGQVYAFDMALPPALSPDRPADDPFYMADAPTGPHLTLPDHIEFAGALSAGPTGDFGIMSSRNPLVMPEKENQAYACDFTGMTCSPQAQSITTDDTIEGLAEVGGTLYAISVQGKVSTIDPTTGAATDFDDLSSLFRDVETQIRLRGATRVVIP